MANPTNKSRQENALAALIAHKRAKEGHYGAHPDADDLTDLLADLRHWADTRSSDADAYFQQALDNSHRHHVQEKTK